MNWMTFALKLPLIISGIMSVIEKVKGAKGAEKKAAVLEAIPESVSLIEFAAGRDLLNDPVIASLVSAFIDAEKIALVARDALKAGILAKSVVPPVQ